MVSLDKEKIELVSPKSEKDWTEIRKNLKQRMNNIDPTTAKIQRRTKQAEGADKPITQKPKDTLPEKTTKSPKPLDFDPSPPIDGRASPLEVAMHASSLQKPLITEAVIKETITSTQEYESDQSPPPLSSLPPSPLKPAERSNKSTTLTQEINKDSVPDRPSTFSTQTNEGSIPNRPSTFPTQTKHDSVPNQPSTFSTKTEYDSVPNRPSTFPSAYADENLETLDQDDLGPDRSGLTLLQAIKTGSISAVELDADERRVVVKILKNQGRTQDEISGMLQVSRRTIVSDYKAIRAQLAETMRHLDSYDVAGEIWDQAHNAVQKALEDGKYRTVSQVLRDMVEMLQSLGVLYRAPTTSKVASIVGKVQSHQGYTRYMTAIGGEKDRVIGVLQSMMHSIEQGRIH